MDFLLLLLFFAAATFCIAGPGITMATLTIRRIKKFKKSGGKLRLQYQISDLLAATLCIGVVAAFLHFIFHETRQPFWYSAYFVIATSVGILAGKLWQWSTVKNSLRDGPTYIIVGAVLWLLASLGPAFAFYLVNVGIFPPC
jgi:uncharacterized membrane protein YidH (DUF202 family)